jgi:hypothetical protein
MKKHDSGTITGIAEATAERVRLGGELLQALAHAVARNEKTQQRFRTAVLMKLSRIEAMAQLTYVAQVGEPLRNRPYYEEKLKEEAIHAEEFISQNSEKVCLQMMKYIYEEPEAPSVRGKRGRKRKWPAFSGDSDKSSTSNS